MTELLIETSIDLPKEASFDLLRDPRVLSGANVSGAFAVGQTVTFETKMIGIAGRFQTRVVTFDRPHSFVDEMASGPLISFIHIHMLEDQNGGTRLIDILRWKTPYSLFGRLFDEVFLKRSIRKIVVTRNQKLKAIAS